MSHREQRRLYISSSEVCVLLSPWADRDTRRAGRDFSLVWGRAGGATARMSAPYTLSLRYDHGNAHDC